MTATRRQLAQQIERLMAVHCDETAQDVEDDRRFEEYLAVLAEIAAKRDVLVAESDVRVDDASTKTIARELLALEDTMEATHAAYAYLGPGPVTRALLALSEHDGQNQVEDTEP